MAAQEDGNMEVLRKAIAIALLIFGPLLLGCQNAKTTDNVVRDTSQDQKQGGFSCKGAATQALATSFLVEWENGRITVEKSENLALFKEKFIRPRLAQIKAVELDRMIQLDDRNFHPSSATPPTDWGQTMVRANAAWSQGIKGQGVTVAIVDTAVDYSHPQLKSQMVPGWDFVDNIPVAKVPHSHATHVAGVIGGAEGGQVLGLAPQAKMMGVSFLDSSGSGSLGDAVNALQYAAEHGAKIINNSWGGDACSLTMRSVMQSLEAKGILLLVAAGNDSNDIEFTPTYPAAFNLPGQITVAAGDSYDHMASFSNDSYKLVHLAAPGDGIFSSVPITQATPNGYQYMSGTSMATPFVSGAAALLLSTRPAATPAQLRQALLSSVDIATYRVLTRGRLNIQKAIEEIKKLVP